MNASSLWIVATRTLRCVVMFTLGVLSLNLAISQETSPPAEATGSSQAPSSAASQTMQFSDDPHFSVAGVTDWTAVGGHGSDSILRTSESLATATASLQPNPTLEKPQPLSPTDLAKQKSLLSRLPHEADDFNVNYELGRLYLREGRYSNAAALLAQAHRLQPGNESTDVDLILADEGAHSFTEARSIAHESVEHTESPELYRLAAELDERAGDPLAAVHEFEQATRLAPNEQNYLEWGSELLLHRAVWQAVEVFQKGSGRFPNSTVLQAGLGSALFAGARYQDAASHLCKASDLDPENPTPYMLMGKVQLAAPDPLSCIQLKLAKFASVHPDNANAEYLYAMALLKSNGSNPAPDASRKIASLLEHAVAVDPKCSDAYLQLGILKAAQQDMPAAMSAYNQAIAANPELADAYYRLGMAYEHTGAKDEAKRAFAMHDRLKEEEAKSREAQRRSVKQFLFSNSTESPALSPQ